MDHGRRRPSRLPPAASRERDAIVVGAGTVRADDPSLTVRNVEGKDPIRVVLGTAPAGARVLPALQFTGELTDLLDTLGQRGVLQVLVEGGATVAGAFHRAGLVDHYVIYLAPSSSAATTPDPCSPDPVPETIADVWRGAITNVTSLGGDVRIDLSPVGPSPVTGPVPVVRIGSVPPVSDPAPGGA